jgi:hypothetical protein
MQRALFLIEATGERISALINPERLELTRRSGVDTLRHVSGSATGATLSDDMLFVTGGGSTELVLDLLFDVDLAETRHPAAAPALAESPISQAEAGTGPSAEVPVVDVRELTRPFWNLSENLAEAGRNAKLPVVRFIWGRSWNLPGVISDVAERFERFDQEGRPRRSFIRMKLRRVAEPDAEPAQDSGAPAQRGSVTPFYEFPSLEPGLAGDVVERVEAVVGETGMPSVPLYQLAASTLGDPAQWRSIATFNDMDDPFHLDPGTLIALPGQRRGEGS